MPLVHSCPLSSGATSYRWRGLDRLRSVVAPVGVLAAAAAGLVWFWNLGATTSSSSPSPESILFEVLRLAGVGVTGWLLVSALLTLVATTIDRARGAAGACGMSETLRRFASPLVRRLVERALAATILTSVVAAAPVNPASAVGSGEVPPSGVEEPVIRLPEPVEPIEPRAPASSPASPVVPPPSDPAVRVPAVDVPAVHVPAVHVIVAGDNLWSVAADHLAASASGTRSGDAEIGAYWARLIEANRSTLRSGDPDLVFPGERIALPPTRR